MHFGAVMGYDMQYKLLWCFYTNEMDTVSNCYESVLWLQSHMLPCNFGETPMFWNPVPLQGLRKVARRACARIPDVMIPWFDLPNSVWTCVRRTVWFVELAYRACVSNVRNPYVNSSAVNQREYRTFDVIKSIAIECGRTQPGVHKVSTILGAVMDSRNNKTIVQRRSDSGRRLRHDCECNTGPDLDPN